MKYVIVISKKELPDSWCRGKGDNSESGLSEEVRRLNDEDVFQPEAIQLGHLPEENEDSKLDDSLEGGVPIQPVRRRPAVGRRKTVGLEVEHGRNRNWLSTRRVSTQTVSLASLDKTVTCDEADEGCSEVGV